MKRFFFALFVLIAVATSSFAQLKVLSNGNTIMGFDGYSYNPPLIFGSSCNFKNTAIQVTNGAASLGISNSLGSGSSSVACGVAGVAGYSAGSNYGVYGGLAGMGNGAAIIGTTQVGSLLSLPSRYAGFFSGNVMVVGTLNATVVSSSDSRLKDNVAKLGTGDVSSLTMLNKLNPVSYTYKASAFVAAKDSDGNVDENIREVQEKTHYGLIAQQLQEVYPDLVYKDGNGYLSVNYTELIPVLIQAVKELKEEIDVLRGEGAVSRAPVATPISTATTNRNVLYQNTPNPFKEQTTIRFQLADDAQNAAICIFDMTGKQIKKFPVSAGMESVTVNGYELGEGIFLYSLVVNGLEIGTKRMVFSK